ncbi:MAG TPA: type II toxin-antitoxin system prevent-host-death family antitoxin [Lacipirellulaceae bacterium]|nr:type II toxin-antitoxin system prevent-host-death family antitoxin [Lacipirellulaceae bacterium]HMP07836.1 type II toxin-antitoxin system prevent-host-death family antitoxin [Lacipirellulaceae bacterium]
MTQIALADAETRLRDIVAAVAQGEEFVITLDGKPVANVTPAAPKKPPPVFGSAKGKIHMADDFDAPLDDFADYMQ